MELVVDKYLFGNAAKAFLVGLVFTAIVQSSSATLSIVVPMAGAGLLTLRQIFPYAVGANIGTTVTAMLAALVTGSPAAVQLAFAHLTFNVLGTAIWYPLRIVPLTFAEWWGGFCSRHRIWALVYVAVLFFVIPLTVTFLTRR
jgi:sodium-dependent phosphate cotransporter